MSRDTPPADVVVGQARATEALEELHDTLALVERVHEQGERAGVRAGAAERHHVTRDALELAGHHAQVLPALRDLHAGEPFERAAVRPVGVHAADVVEPVRQRHHLQVRAVLGDLLDAAVQVADDRLGLRDHLAVEVRDDAAHAVRGRVRRADVDDELLEGAATLARDRLSALDFQHVSSCQMKSGRRTMRSST
jgi:hypothetical protein